ncbi:MAG: GGDEF domain-containing protein, partial [Gammaproteobacteria bacterium]|nr:GGDEF domain-containing protein [Gammaproteobacteria bacterium]
PQTGARVTGGPLTGIANRRCFGERLAAEIDVARAVGQPLTLAVADLDHFKVVNDRLGHSVGDEVLRQSALLMRQLCRTTDLVARIGGEEFALILPGMARESARASARRCARASKRMTGGACIRICASP